MTSPASAVPPNTEVTHADRKALASTSWDTNATPVSTGCPCPACPGYRASPSRAPRRRWRSSAASPRPPARSRRPSAPAATRSAKPAGCASPAGPGRRRSAARRPTTNQRCTSRSARPRPSAAGPVAGGPPMRNGPRQPACSSARRRRHRSSAAGATRFPPEPARPGRRAWATAVRRPRPARCGPRPQTPHARRFVVVWRGADAREPPADHTAEGDGALHRAALRAQPLNDVQPAERPRRRRIAPSASAPIDSISAVPGSGIAGMVIAPPLFSKLQPLMVSGKPLVPALVSDT